MRRGISLNEKAKLLREHLGEKEYFDISDVEDILPQNKNTLQWSLWMLNEQGLIKRTGKGTYTFKGLNEKRVPLPRLSSIAYKAYDVLIESEFRFVLSGLDILSIFMQHIPERYPNVIYVEPGAESDVMLLLNENGIESRDYTTKKGFNYLFSVDNLIYVGNTRIFSYQRDGLASFERAFVDIYYEITRNSFPFHLQELVRIYQNMREMINIDIKRMIKIASRRNFHYDIRFIIEHKRITKHAYKFVEIVHKEGR